MSTVFDEEQVNRNQERYERFLDRMMVESANPAARGGTNGRNGQQRPIVRLNYPSLEHVLRTLAGMPLFLSILHAPEESEPFPDLMTSPPDHFVDRFAWNMTRQMLHRMRQAEKPAWEHRKSRARREKVRHLDMHLGLLDPLYPRTIQAIEVFLKKLPPRTRGILMRKFSKDHGLFLDLYREQREVAALVEGMLHARRQAATVGQ